MDFQEKVRGKDGEFLVKALLSGIVPITLRLFLLVKAFYLPAASDITGLPS
jgi:hypothetical protein